MAVCYAPAPPRARTPIATSMRVRKGAAARRALGRAGRGRASVGRAALAGTRPGARCAAPGARPWPRSSTRLGTRCVETPSPADGATLLTAAGGPSAPRARPRCPRRPRHQGVVLPSLPGRPADRARRDGGPARSWRGLPRCAGGPGRRGAPPCSWPRERVAAVLALAARTYRPGAAVPLAARCGSPRGSAPSGPHAGRGGRGAPPPSGPRCVWGWGCAAGGRGAVSLRLPLVDQCQAAGGRPGHSRCRWRSP